MNNSFLKISNFLNEPNYTKLKMYFIKSDLYFLDKLEKINIEKENPSITYKDIYYESNGAFDEEVVIDVKEVKFIEDFILKGFDNLIQNELADFENYCFKKGLTTKQLRTGHLEQLKKKFSKYRSDISIAQYLPEKVKVHLISTLNEIPLKISRELGITYQKRPERIKVNLKKNELQALFYLLWRNQIIKATSPSEIGNVLDFCFQYKNDKGDYQDFYQSRKEIADFQSNKGLTSPLAKIQSIFSNPDTYNIY